MKLLFFDETKRIMSIPDEVLKSCHKTREQLLNEQEKENAALLICATQLGPIYSLMEVIDTYLIDLMPQLKRKNWFKFNIKFNFNATDEKLDNIIKSTLRNSLTDDQVLIDLSDEVANFIKIDLFKLENAIYLDLSKKLPKFKDNKILSKIIVTYILIKVSVSYYESIIKSMEKIYPAQYDSWFGGKIRREILYHWELGLEFYLKSNNIKEINLNESQEINWGIEVLHNKMTHDKISEIGEANDIRDTNKDNLDLFNEACKLLKIN